MNVLVLKGGTSDEREVSLRSAKAVTSALQAAGHMVTTYDTQYGLEQLATYASKVNVVFPVLHGAGGEDGVVQAMLEKYNLPYVGADSSVSELCFDKAIFKQRIRRLGVRTPKGHVVTTETIEDSPLLKRPFVLKPVCGGSSVNMHIVRHPVDHQLDFADIFARDERMLLEELIEGQEITVPVLGNRALPVIEIIPPEGAEFDYQNKYNGATQELCPARNVADETQQEAQHIAEQLHNKLGVRHLSRTDFMLSSDNQLYVLELNTIPGLTDESLFPKSAQQAGMSMVDVVDFLLKQAAAVTP